jgi:aryl-alcohol dehydrogenase-like predicted oxidoreductase
MHYRPLGKSGLSVSEIGFGAWGIGGATTGPTSYGHTDDAASCAALEKALDVGINFFDTSNVYGDGHSERLIGKVFSKRRSEVIIATKAGFMDFASPPDFSATSIRKSVESSLERLNTDYIDLLQLHNPSAEWLSENQDTLELLERLQKDGKVRALGISVKSPSEAFSLLDMFPFQSVQANFNMLDIRVLECGLMEKLDAVGAGLIARTPMSFGFLSGRLTGEETFPAEDHRSRWPREQIQLWVEGARALQDACAESAETPAYQVALRYCLSYPQVSTTIVGMLTPDEVVANAIASDSGTLSSDSCSKVEALHAERSFVVR